jgi:hypothetical protein
MVIDKLPKHLSKICAYTALCKYLDLNKEHYDQLNCRQIWLHYNGSKVVSHETLSKDTRALLLLAGIDPIFGAATYRHAAITYWRNNGVPLPTACSRTGHRSIHLVVKYYDRSRIAGDINAMILQNPNVVFPHHDPNSYDIPEDFSAMSSDEGF